MISFTKKRSRGRVGGQNTLSLKRFKKRIPKWHKRKRVETTVFNKNEQKGLFLLQQMSIRKGKKMQSEKRILNLLINLKKKYPNRDQSALLNNLLKKYRALIFLRSKRLGSVTYKIPISLYKEKGIRVMARWIMSKSQSKNNNINSKIFDNITNLSKKQGDIYKKRQELHKLGYAGIPYLTYIKRDSIYK